jgi:O-glycosyl hydrolase
MRIADLLELYHHLALAKGQAKKGEKLVATMAAARIMEIDLVREEVAMRDSLVSTLKTSLAVLVFLATSGRLQAQQPIRLVVQPERVRQVFDGLGAGAIFYEQHITSLAARNQNDLQEKLYDDMFTRVRTRYLALMIRETHEPVDDRVDPYKPAFDDNDFAYCQHPLQIGKAALKRRPDMQFIATLLAPPPWMKTNNAVSGGGEARHTLKPGLELRLARYLWGFLDHMHRNGVTIHYLNISNESDWPHTQPSYFLTPERYAMLFKTVGEYLDKMAKTHPQVPRPKLIAPNTLSAPVAAEKYLPLILKSSARYLDVIGAHDYDPRGDRWGALRKLAGTKPLWVTEWSARGKDATPGLLRSALDYGEAMHEAFTGGANVWLAYDWVYPPRDSGEALIHVVWGQEYSLTKPYHLFRQWAEPLTPGMRVLDLGPASVAASKAGPKLTAFLAKDGRSVVVHAVNMQAKAAAVSVKLTGKLAGAASAQRTRTSAEEDAAALPPLKIAAGSFADKLPPRSMVTYRVEAASK